MWVVVTWPGVFLAYRADMPALPAGALASVVVVCPIALAVIARRWGALLGAIAVMFIVGRGLIVAGPLWRAFAIVIVMAVMAQNRKNMTVSGIDHGGISVLKSPVTSLLAGVIQVSLSSKLMPKRSISGSMIRMKPTL